MDKKIITIMFGIFLIGVVTAGLGLTPHDSTIDVSKETNDELILKGLTNIKNSDCIRMSEDYCEFKMYNGDYKLGSHKIPLRRCNVYETGDQSSLGSSCLEYYTYSEQELKDFMDVKKIKWLENFANVSIQRKDNGIGDVEVTGGSITFREKK